MFISGKSIQNSRDHINVHFARTEKAANERALANNYLGAQIISESCVAIASRPTTVKLDRAFAIGFSILEISKLIIYDNFYNCLKPHFDDKVSLIATDTGKC